MIELLTYGSCSINNWRMGLQHFSAQSSSSEIANAPRPVGMGCVRVPGRLRGRDQHHLGAAGLHRRERSREGRAGEPRVGAGSDADA